MDFSILAGIPEWLAANPGWATFLIFVVALCEGLVGVGLVVPGATLLFVAGAFVGTGHLELGPSLAAAAVGAFIGDSVSFWLGRYFGEPLRGYWPLRRFPKALRKGEAFFHAHGGKSVVLGRFVGPVRGIIPAVAGMLAMPTGRFMVVNLLSALAWAPAYLLPGLVFGAALAVAAAVTGRLVVLVLGLLAVAWLGWWALAHLILPWLRRWGAALAWRTRRWGRWHWTLGGTLSGPRHMLRAWSHAVGRLWWFALLALVLLAARQATFGGPTLPDEALLGILKAYLPVEARSVFVLPAQLLEPLAWGPAWLAALCWAAYNRRWRVAAVWLVAIPGAALAAATLAVTLDHYTATALYRDAPPLRFPSPSIAAFSTLILAGAVLATSGYGSFRRPVLALGLVLLIGVAASAVIAGQVWLVDAVAGVLTGIIIAGTLVFAHSSSQGRPPELLLPALVGVVLLAVVSVKGVAVFPEERARFVEERQWPVLEVAEWLEVDALHPLGRELRWLDGGRRVVDLQWLGRDEELVFRLERSGWVEPERRLHGTLRWLEPEPDVARLLPPLRWHRGRLPDLIRAYPLPAAGERLVLRLWRAPVTIAGRPGTVWLATLEHETIHPGWPVARVETQGVNPGQLRWAANTLLRDEELLLERPGDPLRILPHNALAR